MCKGKPALLQLLGSLERKVLAVAFNEEWLHMQAGPGMLLARLHPCRRMLRTSRVVQAVSTAQAHTHTAHVPFPGSTLACADTCHTLMQESSKAAPAVPSPAGPAAAPADASASGEPPAPSVGEPAEPGPDAMVVEVSVSEGSVFDTEGPASSR